MTSLFELYSVLIDAQVKNLPPRRVRHYPNLEKRLRAVQGRVFGQASGYALYHIHLTPSRTTAARLLITAGIHGDEPAGVETVLRLAESPPPWAQKIHLTLFPCLNPWGYEHHTRANADGIDLNRQFRAKKPAAEVAAYRKFVENDRFDLAVALHEDYDATGFYLYELSPRSQSLGPRIIHQVRNIMPIHPASEIEGLPSKNGVIAPRMSRQDLLQRRQWPEAIYLFRRQSPHAITTETPSALPLAQRVRAQLAALQTAVEHLHSAIS